MAEIGYSIAAKLIEVLGCEAIKKVCDMWGYKSELEDLKKTVYTVENVLLDADAKWDQLSHQDQDFIRELKDVVYDADDVFDEFQTLAKLNQLDGKLKKGGKFFGKVRRFFSSKNKVGEAYRMSREIKDIKKRLDLIADNHKKFELKVDNKAIVRRPKETCSYVDVNDIVGRDKDTEAIVNMLLDPNAPNDVCFLAIVGVGGLGKTTLAQLVFRDEKITKEFSNKIWVCISDQDGQQFDVKSVLCKIIDQQVDGNSTLESVLKKFQEKLKGKKYLLVLDDIWNEDREKWLCLKKMLMLGHGGSRVVVTTRSERTGSVTCDGVGNIYKLGSLSEDDSWRLFELSAFTEGSKEENHTELVKIGKKIVQNCYCIPLAIKVVGSLLYDQHISKWRSFEKSCLREIGEGDNEIFRILKFSFYNLMPSLKSCFSYCAVFPKDFRIEKDKIIRLWMAQGYIVPSDGGQSLEDAAEEHFLILLRRCFFQDVERDEFGDVESVKIHDLMHDVALKVGEEETCIVTSMPYSLGDKIRHVHYVGQKNLDIFLCSLKIRSYIGGKGTFNDANLGNWMRLRVLDLSKCELKSLPESLGKLFHLRYLDLSENSLEVLPESIIELSNLQTLDLHDNEDLKELPKGISKLVNLRYLNIEVDSKLTFMPSGMNRLTNLRSLPYFIVGSLTSTENGSGDFATLKDLKAFYQIQGVLGIRIGTNYRNVEDREEEGGYLKSMAYLKGLVIEFDPEDTHNDHEAMLVNWGLPPNLRVLGLYKYTGMRIGRWGKAVDNLPLLAGIEIETCPNLQQIPMLNKLPHLKSLRLAELDSLEYMENGINNDRSDTEAAEFFPSLENLEIKKCKNLKGWWKGEGIRECPNLIYFASCANPENLQEHELPALCSLVIEGCPMLAAKLICPSLEDLKLRETNERLQITCLKLRFANIDKVGCLKSLTTACVTHLTIDGDNKVEDLSDLGICEEDDDEEEPWKSLNQSLRQLDFNRIPEMKCLPKGMQHLTSLQKLNLYGLRNMEGGLPEWIRCLSSLQSLQIFGCPGIKSLPEAIKDLTSLENICVVGCPDLEEFPKIQHIPDWRIVLS